jgi:hypothetical protein
MATRTIKFFGKAYASSGSVLMNVTFNGNEVHNGNVPTVVPTGTERTDDKIVLFTFDVDSSLSGWIPVSMSVSGGEAWYAGIAGNYASYTIDEETNTPLFPADVFIELNVNTIESDGNRNIVFDPEDISEGQVRENVTDERMGDWHYRVADGGTLTFETFIDPNLEVLTVPESVLENLRSQGYDV